MHELVENTTEQALRNDDGLKARKNKERGKERKGAQEHRDKD